MSFHRAGKMIIEYYYRGVAQFGGFSPSARGAGENESEKGAAVEMGRREAEHFGHRKRKLRSSAKRKNDIDETTIKSFIIEVWLSLVERCVRDAEAAGSSPVTSTISSVHNQPESWMWTLDFFLPTFCIFLYV